MIMLQTEASHHTMRTLLMLPVKPNPLEGSKPMKKSPALTRRGFIRTTAAGSGALGWLGAPVSPMAFASDSAKPALLSGTPVHKGGWTKWPQWREAWEPDVLKVFRSGRWFRGSDSHVEEFEKGYAQLLGAKRCLATASGTT